MSIIRPAFRAGLGVRSLHTCMSSPFLPFSLLFAFPRMSPQDTARHLRKLLISTARVLAIQATRPRRDGSALTNEVLGYKYVPGGRKCYHSPFWSTAEPAFSLLLPFLFANPRLDHMTCTQILPNTILSRGLVFRIAICATDLLPIK